MPRPQEPSGAERVRQVAAEGLRRLLAAHDSAPLDQPGLSPSGVVSYGGG